jgi:hypothetical protein
MTQKYGYDSKFYYGGQRKAKILKSEIFETLEKARPYTESIKGSNLAAVRLTTFEVAKLPL